MFMAIARDTRATREAWITAIVAIRTVRSELSAAITIKANRIGGKDSKTSMPQVTKSSKRPRISAAANPTAMPITKPATVAASATPTVSWAP